jgi:nitrogen fixation-related uncharacterized protein
VGSDFNADFIDIIGVIYVVRTTKHAGGKMNIVPFLVLFSLCLVAFSIILFVYLFKQDDYDQADRMALAPLRDDGERRESEQ